MSAKNEFVIYCIELLKNALGIPGAEAYRRLGKSGVHYLQKTYPALHTVSDEIVLGDLLAITGEVSAW